MNAKVGREGIYKHVTGGKSKDAESNENGKLLIEFAEENNMKIKSTSFDHKDIHKATWISPDEQTKNQIDHILIENKLANAMLDSRSYRGADADTDQFLVIAKIKQKIPEMKFRRNERVRKYNITKMANKDIARKLENRITSEMNKRMVLEDINSEWELIEKVVLEAMEDCLGEASNRTSKGWFDEECENVLMKRNRARMELLKNETQENKNQYENLRREAKQICRSRKREFLKRKILKIEEHSVNKEIRNFYQEAKNSKEKFNKGSLIFCKSKEGALIGDMQGKLERWAKYFEELLNETDEEDVVVNREDVEFGTEEVVDEPSDIEIDKEIKKLKNGKSGGENGIPAEVLKKGGEKLRQRIGELIRKVWREERMPGRWRNEIEHYVRTTAVSPYLM